MTAFQQIFRFLLSPIKFCFEKVKFYNAHGRVTDEYDPDCDEWIEVENGDPKLMFCWGAAFCACIGMYIFAVGLLLKLCWRILVERADIVVKVVIVFIAVLGVIEYLKEPKGKEKKADTVEYDVQELMKAAERDYVEARNAMYKTLTEIDGEIGVKTPTSVLRLEPLEHRILIVDGVSYLRFNLPKEEVGIRLKETDLKEFRGILEENLIRTMRESPGMSSDNPRNINGEPRKPVYVDSFDDLGTFILVNVVFYSPAYEVVLKTRSLKAQQQDHERVAVWGQDDDR